MIDYSLEAGVALVTLNDPPANTYSYEMMQQLDARILEARMDESVQVIVLIGAGEKFFCAGANIAMLSEVTPEFKYYFCLHANESWVGSSRLRSSSLRDERSLRRRRLEVAMAADFAFAAARGQMGRRSSLGVLPELVARNGWHVCRQIYSDC